MQILCISQLIMTIITKLPTPNTGRFPISNTSLRRVCVQPLICSKPIKAADSPRRRTDAFAASHGPRRQHGGQLYLRVLFKHMPSCYALSIYSLDMKNTLAAVTELETAHGTGGGRSAGVNRRSPGAPGFFSRMDWVSFCFIIFDEVDSFSPVFWQIFLGGCSQFENKL